MLTFYDAVLQGLGDMVWLDSSVGSIGLQVGDRLRDFYDLEITTCGEG